jgi:signal transduction histidine kinase
LYLRTKKGKLLAVEQTKPSQNRTEIPMVECDGRLNPRSAAAMAAFSGKAVVVDDAYAEPRFDFSELLREDSHNSYRTRSILAVPLTASSGESIGVLEYINSKDPLTSAVRPFPGDFISFVEALAAQSAVALENQTHVEDLKSQFLSRTAHELRTPMTSILGYSELLASKHQLTSVQTDTCIETIHEQAELMVQILDDLLDLSRLQSLGNADFEIQDVELSQVVMAVIKNFKVPAGRSKPQLQLLEIDARVDQGRAYQVILNLISNAYKYSLDGVVEILMAIAGDNKHVELQIKDYGIGIAPENQARLFERFYRVDNSGSIPGTGLGLSIVKEIMAQMGGEVALTSSLGVGTTVRLLFPRPIAD